MNERCSGPRATVRFTWLRRYRAAPFALALAACASGGASAPTRSPALGGAQTVVDDRLFFGLSIPTGGQVSDSAWSVFLLEVVTPRFPSGLTVWRAEGQWLDPHGTLVREPSMVVEVFHPRGEPADSIFERVAAEYRRRFHQDAVLRTTIDARTELYEDVRSRGSGAANGVGARVDSGPPHSSP